MRARFKSQRVSRGGVVVLVKIDMVTAESDREKIWQHFVSATGLAGRQVV